VEPGRLVLDRGGEGPDLLLFLHGLGASGAVWDPMLGDARATARGLDRWDGTWAVPDLRGHGRSPHGPPYSVGVHVADVATVVAETGAESVTVVGHSFGGVLGAVLASEVFGLPVRGVLAVGVKLDWTDDEIAGGHRVAQRDRRVFATRAEAAGQALRFAGLQGLLDPGDPRAQQDVVEVPGGFAAAVDPRTFSVVGADVRALMALCRAPLRLAAGSADPGTSLDAMRPVDPSATVIDGAGHNAHWERPDEVWRLLEGMS